MTCKDNRDGSCSVEYTPTELGEYDVSVQFAEKHIPGSPFKVVGFCYSWKDEVFSRMDGDGYSPALRVTLGSEHLANKNIWGKVFDCDRSRTVG